MVVAPAETNIVVAEGVRAAHAVEALAAHGVRASALSDTTLRMVTHHDVDDDGVDRAVDAIRVVGLVAAAA